MPYNNVPSDKTAAMESCVAQVQADGKPKQAAIAICYSSIMGKKVLLSPYPVPDVPIGDLIPPEGGDPLSWQQVSERTDEWARKQLSRREAAARARCAVQGCTASPTQLVSVKGAVLPYCEEHLPGAKDVLARHSIKVEGVRSAEQVWVDAKGLQFITNEEGRVIPIGGPGGGGGGSSAFNPQTANRAEMEQRGYIAVFRGTGEAGIREVRPSSEGELGPGIYFYDDPIQARTYAEPGGGIVTGFVHPDSVSITDIPGGSYSSPHRVIVAKDVADFIRRGDIPTELTSFSSWKPQELARWEQTVEGALNNITNQKQLGYDEKQEHTGAILALKPPAYIADEVAVEGGLAPTELHVTLVYLGETADLDKDEILILAERLAQGLHPFTAKLDGTIRFAEGAVALNVNAPYIPEMRQQLVETLRGLGHEVTDVHGFTPHLTVGYEEDGVEIEPHLPTEPEVEFNELWLFWGGEHVAFPLLSRKELQFITRDGQVVPIGGPSSGGGGATGSTGGQASHWTNPSGATTNSKDDIIQFLAANGIPESDVVFSGSTRGIDGHPVLAEIDVRNNKIIVSEQAMKAKSDIRPVLVHEMMHLRTMNNSELAQKVKNTVGQEQWEKGYWNSMNNAGAVSEYATWHIGRSSGNLVIKEHLAEVARLDYEGKLSTVPSGWVNLYQQVMAGNE